MRDEFGTWASRILPPRLQTFRLFAMWEGSEELRQPADSACRTESGLCYYCSHKALGESCVARHNPLFLLWRGLRAFTIALVSDCRLAGLADRS